MFSCSEKPEQSGLIELEKFIIGLPKKKGALIDVLHKAQEIFGYLPKEVQEFVAEKLGLPVSNVYGVVQFYSFFTMVPRGKYPISVCMGTACYIKGVDKVLVELNDILKINTGEVTKDGLFSMNTLRCVGACALAPLIMIGDKIYGKLKAEDLQGIINSYREKEVQHNG